MKSFKCRHWLHALLLLSMFCGLAGCRKTDAPISLTVAVMDDDAVITQLTGQFQAQQDAYEVVIQNFENIRALLDALENGGPDAPDLFFIPFNVGTADGGLDAYCVNLVPFLENSRDLRAEDFVPGLYSGCRQQGELHYMPFDFTVQTFGMQPIPDENATLTIEAAQQIARERQETLFPSHWDRETLLQWVSPYLAQAYADPDNFTGSFDSPSFLSLIEALKQHPAAAAEYSESQNSLLQYVSLDGQLRMLASYEFFRQTDGTDYGFPGVPGTPANGSLLCINQCFGMFSSCENKNVAWQFLKFLLTEEAQSLATELPAIQTALEDRVAALHLSREASDKVLHLIAETTCVKSGSPLNGIVQAELAAFFDGRITAREAAENLRQRAEEYSSET